MQAACPLPALLPYLSQCSYNQGKGHPKRTLTSKATTIKRQYQYRPCVKMSYSSGLSNNTLSVTAERRPPARPVAPDRLNGSCSAAPRSPVSICPTDRPTEPGSPATMRRRREIGVGRSLKETGLEGIAITNCPLGETYDQLNCNGRMKVLCNLKGFF